MVYKITRQCISCGRCESSCPTGAIKIIAGDRYLIDSSLCTSCVGAYGVAQCAAECPIQDGCVKALTDYWESWFATHDRLVAKLKGTYQADYWERWFNLYSAKISEQFSKRKQDVVSLEV
ncbi:4Fe-4S binding protein [Tolypothrix sp. FACHB-123]|uniref:4Fe-4S binding protein n=1 Tax=Tolypothrix sp. FACHB-123 TaxID=2692868 RepID=UPI0016844AB4|nr:4Fe-4S binding protein [Tolypothrix sp. FACHB-123]MBD2357334.1 4Fe-4S binding protein [Tolypothrix sp. FACHB-123]